LVMGHGWWFLDTTLLPHGPTPNDAFSNFGFRVQYTLDTRGQNPVDLEVTYWGGDRDRRFEIHANLRKIATEELKGEHPGEFVRKRYPIPAELLAKSPDGKVTIKFIATQWVAGGVFDVRLMKGR
jgi:hypothetical protein